MTRILIVEDEEHLAAGLRFNLEAEGYEATIAPTGSVERYPTSRLMTAERAIRIPSSRR